EPRFERTLEPEARAWPVLHAKSGLRGGHSLRLQEEARPHVHGHESALAEVAAELHFRSNQEAVELAAVARRCLDRHVGRSDVEHVRAQAPAGTRLELIQQKLVEEHVEREGRYALRYHLARGSDEPLGAAAAGYAAALLLQQR